jgi:ABC-type lipoprotein release transport system permease subunit
LRSLDAAGAIINVLIALIGAIALSLTFFLLLVATTQNIKDNVWEYGVLRSMGVTKNEGNRLFMYEAFLVIVSSALIGLAIGTSVACLVTAQFYMFLELPFALQFPWGLIAAFIGLALITTYFAVAVPVNSVNSRNIASVLKSGV